MKGDAPKAPITQGVQPEVKDVSQTPSPPAGGPAGGSTPPTKLKKRLKTKILKMTRNTTSFCRTKRGLVIILIILVGLGVGGFFIYKNIFIPEEKLKEESLQPISEIDIKPKFGYMQRQVEWQQIANGRERYGYLNLSWERAMSSANWNQIEPRRGEYHWEYIDRYVRTAQEKNIQILFTVLPFTDWDQETCNMDLGWQSDKLCFRPNSTLSNCGKDLGKYGDAKDTLTEAYRLGKPCDMEAYKEFFRRMVERYDNDGIDDMSGLLYSIRHWEIGNEVDMDGFQDSAEEYFEMLKVAYTTIKQADPNAKVHISAMGIPPGEWVPLEPGMTKAYFDTVKLFELGAANYFDIMSNHGLEGYKGAREFLIKYDAGDKPIWITEPGDLGKYRGLSEEEIAFRLFQVFERELKYGVEMFMGFGSHWMDRAVHQAILHINYIKDGGNSDSFLDVWCGNKIVQEGEECETMFPIIDDAGVSARKPGTDCAPIEGMAAECIECACVYHETVCGDNISEGDEACEIAWNCEFIRGKAPTCEECKCVYHEGSYCGNDIPEEGEECERDFECDEAPEGFEVTCEECKGIQSKLSIRLN